MKFSLAVLYALEIEAEPFIRLFGMREQRHVFNEKLNLRLFVSDEHSSIAVVLFGACPRHGVERIGTQIATMAALETIRVLNPKTIASVGTAGGFLRKGAQVGDVYYSEAIFFHGRHIDFPKYRDFELGGFPCALLSNLGDIKKGVISSSDSIPVQKDEQEKLTSLNTDAKDMEAAAIAEIAALFHTPMFALKAISDFVDVEGSTFEQFQVNYRVASQNVANALQYVIMNNGFLENNDSDNIFASAHLALEENDGFSEVL